jgi:phosphopentomutase
MNKTSEYQSKDFNGLCFINLVDFDMVYGHRNDTNGYARAFTEFDKWLDTFIDNMKPDDALIITADHGCDPGFKGTDHTREYVPFIMYGKKIAPENAGTIDGYTYVSQWVKKLLE